jgi:hypothetical protein
MTYPDHHAREMAKRAHHRLDAERRRAEDAERQVLMNLDESRRDTATDLGSMPPLPVNDD